MKNYTRNHYVPEWYQYRFIPDSLREKKFYYLDLKPAIVTSNGYSHKRKALLRWGPPTCFFQDDLYTTKFGNWESTEIEQKFFGKLDSKGQEALEYFAKFKHPAANGEKLHAILEYMSAQKLRTPKGLDHLSKIVNLNDKNKVLYVMQRLSKIFCSLWAECIWVIADASNSPTKFIISDHPVTVYNKGCFPKSKWCLGFADPDIAFSGTHTLFPLSQDKLLILTNLSWLRNPYGNPLKPRPNPVPFRGTIFNFTQIQTNRELSELEVNEINFIIKLRAYRYVAAVNKDWLYPEKKIDTNYWNKLGKGYLLMPDPRLVNFTTDLVIGTNDGESIRFDEYGHKPGQNGYSDSAIRNKEWNTFNAFRGEFARVYGPKYKGQTYELVRSNKSEDDPQHHTILLKSEQIYKSKIKK